MQAVVFTYPLQFGALIGSERREAKPGLLWVFAPSVNVLLLKLVL
jgi:hypothetical protein